MCVNKYIFLKIIKINHSFFLVCCNLEINKFELQGRPNLNSIPLLRSDSYNTISFLIKPAKKSKGHCLTFKIHFKPNYS